MRKIAPVLAAAGLVTAPLAIVGATAGSASATSCPNNSWSNLTNALIGNNFRNDGVNIRTGDSSWCLSVGQGQRTHDTVLHCYSYNGAYFWDHLRDVSNARSGWVREDQLYIVSGNPC